jgi:FlaA1/EpsC-like NDP-sugar epimerase
VDTIFAAYKEANRGETYIPRVPSARVVDIATALIGNLPIQTVITGIRPGEKLHEILISEEECHRSVERGSYYAILPMLPELSDGQEYTAALHNEFSSADIVMDFTGVMDMLRFHRLMLDDNLQEDGELLR